MTTTTVPFRRPTFSWKKALKPVKNFFVHIFTAMIEARQRQADYHLAEMLRAQCPDYKNMTSVEIYRKIREGRDLSV